MSAGPNSIDFRTVNTKSFELSDKALDVLSPEIRAQFKGKNNDNVELDYNVIIIDKKPKKLKKTKKIKNIGDIYLGKNIPHSLSKEKNVADTLDSLVFNKHSNIPKYLV